MIKAENISKTFNGQGAPTKALVNVSLTVEEGEFVSVVGRSGSGKTTLLHILSTLQKPDSGSLVYNNADIVRVEEGKLNTIRHKDFAVIFQFHHLLPYLTVLENALLPFMNGLRPVPRQRVEEARQCLERVGLGGKWDRLPSMLSGGEQQRAAIARALVKKARCLFADEPTGSLDKATGEEILSLLKDLNKDGLAVVMVTHDPQYAAYADTVVEMEDGAIKSIARQ